ncbi:site-specific recombinase PinR [Mycobacteroides abscessus subsp. bolletii]|nr:site-specific recombinase PinR [Mycobacteroides abscessus subsp. bolletii]SKP78006.1 site-specific recombinase PinR [Mycobacteroides abscessus subsp. bolletii]SKQ03469.1 site-specific recombinase PinR [Mycobacteroides abscessus subsp. bolletii]SKQ12335.1 site-specific recombinase PinR [Mycobacteroides abscessus subsp. bolletii]
MDRLARNLEDLRRIVRELTGQGVRVEFVKESLTFTGEDSRMNTLLLSMLGVVAEFESWSVSVRASRWLRLRVNTRAAKPLCPMRYAHG